VSRNTPEIFGRKNCGVEIWKVSKKHRIRKSVHFFKFQGFSGFSDFQLRIEVKFQKKGRFRRFGKNFHVLPAGGRRPFYMGRKSERFFFEKCGTRFRFWVRFCAALLEKSVGRKWRSITPIGCCAGVSFPTLFCSDSGCEMASKKKSVFCSTIMDMKWGGVDVIPWLPFSKTRFPRF
jgi:hypothetical protein